MYVLRLHLIFSQLLFSMGRTLSVSSSSLHRSFLLCLRSFLICSDYMTVNVTLDAGENFELCRARPATASFIQFFNKILDVTEVQIAQMVPCTFMWSPRTPEYYLLLRSAPSSSLLLQLSAKLASHSLRSRIIISRGLSVCLSVCLAGEMADVSQDARTFLEKNIEMKNERKSLQKGAPEEGFLSYSLS